MIQDHSFTIMYEMGYTNVYEFGGIYDWTGVTETSETKEDEVKTIYLAGGCFWGVQKYFDQFDGVESTEVGLRTVPGKRRATRKSAVAVAMQRL